MVRARKFLRIMLLVAAIVPGRQALGQGGAITVGSLNVEWFGDANKPRDASAIAALARYIRALEVDVLCCQEINPVGDRSRNGRADWLDLLDALGPPFEGRVGTTGVRQRLALIWRGDRVAVSDVGELRGIARVPVGSSRTFPRVPLTAFVRPLDGGADFRLITAHLFWTADDARDREAGQLRDWLISYLATGADPDVLLIGDCNTKSLDLDDPEPSTTIANLQDGGWFTCISADHPEPTTPTTRERYDHAFLSASLRDGAFVPGSWDVRREACEAFPEAYLAQISNHCPVTLLLDGPDHDPLVPGDWGIGPDDAPIPPGLAFAVPTPPPGKVSPGLPPLPSKTMPVPLP